MTYIPVAPHVPQASRQSIELGERISETIREYKHVNPSLGLIEVRQAMRFAESTTRPEFARSSGGGANIPLVLGLVLLVLLGVLVLLFFASN